MSWDRNYDSLHFQQRDGASDGSKELLSLHPNEAPSCFWEEGSTWNDEKGVPNYESSFGGSSSQTQNSRNSFDESRPITPASASENSKFKMSCGKTCDDRPPNDRLFLGRSEELAQDEEAAALGDDDNLDDLLDLHNNLAQSPPYLLGTESPRSEEQDCRTPSNICISGLVDNFQYSRESYSDLLDLMERKKRQNIVDAKEATDIQLIRDREDRGEQPVPFFKYAQDSYQNLGDGLSPRYFGIHSTERYVRAICRMVS